MAKQTINIGTTPNDGTGDPTRVYCDKINDNFDELYRSTGWEAVVDTAHTVGSPQSITEGATTNLSNNKGTVFNAQIPTGVTSFWDSTNSKITPQYENDYMMADIMFKCKNSLQSGYFTIYIDIPFLGERFNQVVVCPKDANTETGVNLSFGHFVSSQFAANGGTIKIFADKGNVQIYDKQFRFVRIHMAK